MKQHKKTIIEKTIKFLKRVGYNPQMENNRIFFESFGFDNFKRRHKKRVREILGDNLSEFFYSNNRQTIYLS